jgi:tyrosyl-tRNA synthetase
MMVPILEGTDGVQKMSKSLGNGIGITEPPQEMFGKIMSISDELMFRYFELLTDQSLADIAKYRAKVKGGAIHPMEAKIELARRIITDFHSAEDAKKAEVEFRRVFQQRQQPTEIETRSVDVRDFIIPLAHVQDPSAIPGTYFIRVDKLLAAMKLASSVSEAVRKLREGAVSINGKRCLEPRYRTDSNPLLLQLGRHHVKIYLTEEAPRQRGAGAMPSGQ